MEESFMMQQTAIVVSSNSSDNRTSSHSSASKSLEERLEELLQERPDFLERPKPYGMLKLLRPLRESYREYYKDFGFPAEIEWYIKEIDWKMSQDFYAMMMLPKDEFLKRFPRWEYVDGLLRVKASECARPPAARTVEKPKPIIPPTRILCAKRKAPAPPQPQAKKMRPSSKGPVEQRS